MSNQSVSRAEQTELSEQELLSVHVRKAYICILESADAVNEALSLLARAQPVPAMSTSEDRALWMSLAGLVRAQGVLEDQFPTLCVRRDPS